MASAPRTTGWKKNAIVTGVVLSPIAVLIVLFWLLNLAYQAELEGGATAQPGERTGQPRALP
ncbi:MAG: hypothetical protein ACIAS6_11025 [Phycisphaerales bacterium JB060]